MRTFWAWETTATLRLFGGARGAWAPTGEERGGGISCRHAHSLLDMDVAEFYVERALGGLGVSLQPPSGFVLISH